MAVKVHVGFDLPADSEIGHQVVVHFSSVGYRLLAESPLEWRFHRGNKFVSFFRMDIRAYSTELVVRKGPAQDGRVWVSCDFDAWTFATLTTGGDVGVFEAEGRALESRLRQAALR